MSDKEDAQERRRRLIAEATEGMNADDLMDVLHYTLTYPIDLSTEATARVERLLEEHGATEAQLVEVTEQEVGGMLHDTPPGNTQHHTRLWQTLDDETMAEFAQDAVHHEERST